MPNEFVVKNGLIAQNNSIVSGSLIVTNGITGSLFGTSSQAVSASFTATASYGFFVVSASYAFTASSATNSTNALTASSADNFVVRQSLTASNALVNGRLTAQTLVVSTISSSVVYSSGSNIFGSNLTDVQQMTGSLRVTGSGNHWILGGNVGIGTASPSSILTVSGSNTSCLLLVGSPGAASALFVSGSGNVGIGTTNPSSTLDVRVSRTNGTNVNVISLSDNLTGASTSGFGTRIQGLSNGNSVVSAIGFENGGTGTNNESQISFYTQNVANALTRQMVVSSTGNVGIGTSSPSARLTVSGSNTSCLLLVGSPGAASALFVSGSGNVGIGTTSIPNALGNALQLGGSTTFMSYVNNSYFLNNWYYDASGNARYIGAATSSGYIQDSSGNHKWFSNPSGTANATFTPIEYMRLTSAGNVGIGTTSPSSILTVSGSNTSCLLLVGSPGASSALFVSGSGNVGIGTTSPLQKLHVFGTADSTKARFELLGTAGINEVLQVVNRANWSSGRGVKIGLYVNSGSNETQIGAEIGAVTIGTDQLGSDLFFNVASASVATERMRITSGGNVYIGTSTGDGYRLQINGSSQAAATFGQTYSGVATYSQWVNSSGAFVMGLDGAAGTTERMRITSTGNVGIGTASPSSILTVSGSNTSCLLLVGSPGASSALFVSGSGNVGIGTTTPTTLLDVLGGTFTVRGTQTSFSILSNYAGQGDIPAGTLISLGCVVNNNLGIIPNGNGIANSKITAAAYNGTAWRSMWEFCNVSSGNPNLLLVKSGGSVGVGTTTPSTLLDVSGSGRYTNGLSLTGSVNSLNGYTGSLFGTASQAITASFAQFAFSASFAPGFSVSMSQLTPATTWSFTHNLNSRNPIVQVYDTTFAQIIPNQIVGINNSLAEIRFDYAEAGYAVASNGGGLYVTGSTSLLNQTSAAVTWSFTHNLNSKYVAFEIYDSNDNVIIPSNIRVLNENSAEIHLSTAITGRAVAQFSGISGTPNAFTASYALTASFVPNLNQNVFITGSLRTTGSVSITGSFAQTSGYMVLSQVSQSLNYADDTAAAAAGVPLGGIYRNGNFILIRLS